MTRILTLAAIPFIVVILAGCPQLDAIEGKPSPAKAEVERRAALTLPEPVNLADAVAPDEPEPVVQPVLFVQPVQEAEPQCFEEWRIRRCIDGVASEW